MWNKFINWLLARLEEMSTYVSIFNFLAVLGIVVRPELQSIITNVCVAIDALVLFLVNENKKSVIELEDLKESIAIADDKGLKKIQESVYHANTRNLHNSAKC